MLNHDPKSKDPIKITQKGSGAYQGASMQVIRSEDWFPGHTPVDEVRFVCNWEWRKIHSLIQVVFPTQAELEQGRGARLEIPCDLTQGQVRFQMRNVLSLLRDQLANPVKTAKKTRVLARDCDRKPKSPGCVQWKEITDVFSGAPLVSSQSYQYCDVIFRAGVSDPPRPPAAPLDTVSTQAPSVPDKLGFYLDPDLDFSDLEARQEFQDRMQEWVEEKLKACQGVTSGPPPYDHAACLRAVDQWRADLEVRRPRAECFKGGRRADFDKDTLLNQVCQLGDRLEGAAETSAHYQAYSDEHTRKLTEEQVRDLDLNRMQALAREKVGTWILISSGIWTYTAGSPGRIQCGRDVDCWMQTNLVDSVLDRQMHRLNPGCHFLSGVSFEATVPNFIFVPRTLQDCVDQGISK